MFCLPRIRGAEDDGLQSLKSRGKINPSSLTLPRQQRICPLYHLPVLFSLPLAMKILCTLNHALLFCFVWISFFLHYFLFFQLGLKTCATTTQLSLSFLNLKSAPSCCLRWNSILAFLSTDLLLMTLVCVNLTNTPTYFSFLQLRRPSDGNFSGKGWRRAGGR